MVTHSESMLTISIVTVSGQFFFIVRPVSWSVTELGFDRQFSVPT